MTRPTAAWFVTAGVLAIGRWLLEYTDVEYYDPQSALDYLAVYSQSAAGIATAAALALLWRAPPVRRGAFLLPFAALAFASQSIGNFLEDAVDVDWGEWLFLIGGVGSIFTLAPAALAALSVGSPHRWSGAFLLFGATGGMLGVGLAIMGISWIAFAAWILRQPSPAISIVHTGTAP